MKNERLEIESYWYEIYCYIGNVNPYLIMVSNKNEKAKIKNEIFENDFNQFVFINLNYFYNFLNILFLNIDVLFGVIFCFFILFTDHISFIVQRKFRLKRLRNGSIEPITMVIGWNYERSQISMKRNMKSFY